jgi:hypothetical protein
MTTEFKDNSKEFLDAMENTIKNGLAAAEPKYNINRAEKKPRRGVLLCQILSVPDSMSYIMRAIACSSLLTVI